MSGRTVWFPGHMAKGTRKLGELVGKLDLILEVRDARAPEVTGSPLISSLSKICPVWKVLTKSDLADSSVTSQWLDLYRKSKSKAWAVDLLKGKIDPLRKELEKEIPAHRELRMAVVGIPNVGKSALLNCLVGKKTATVGGIPGVTKGVSWYKGRGFLVVDSPGILDPKSDEHIQKALAWLGCSKAEVIGGYDAVAYTLVEFLMDKGLWSVVQNTWGVEPGEDAYETLESIGRRLGCLLPGNKVDLTLSGRRFLDAFSSGKLGAVSLERPGKVIE